jgi:hypothetical protein
MTRTQKCNYRLEERALHVRISSDERQAAMPLLRYEEIRRSLQYSPYFAHEDWLINAQRVKANEKCRRHSQPATVVGMRSTVSYQLKLAQILLTVRA